MRLVELAGWRGGSVFVNPQTVCAIKKCEYAGDLSGSTVLNMVSQIDIHVKESVLEVARMISEESESA